MQDQVKIVKSSIIIKAAYFGSAQLDLNMEDKVLSIASDVNLIFVTSEWITKPDKRAKVQMLAENNQLSMIAIDEAHLYHYWQEFRDGHPAKAIICYATSHIEHAGAWI